MSNEPYGHEHALDLSEFLSATLKVADLEYDYVSAKVGTEKVLSDMEQRIMARSAIGLLENANLDAFNGGEDRYVESHDPDMLATDEASREYIRLIADRLGSINGYYLTLINAQKMILDQTVRTKDECLMVISLDVSVSPLGVSVMKDRHIAIKGHETMKDILEVGPEDVAIIEQFIDKIATLS